MKVLIACIAMLAVASAVQTEWTLHELSTAIQDPATDPAMLPVYEAALNELMMQLWNGNDAQTITIPVATPVDVAPVTPEVPVQENPAVSSSPLVQIILNIAA